MIKTQLKSEDFGPLNAEQIDAFHATGFVVVRGLFSAEEMEDVCRWTNDVQGWPETPGKHMMYFEEGADSGKRLLNRVENILPYHDGFNALAHGPNMMGACGQLFGEPAAVFKDKINFKLAGGGGFETHQDVQAGWSRYADFHITALVSIDRATPENGCLEIAAGLHDRGLIGNEWEPLDDRLLRDAEFELVETEPGDAVFFDSFAPHRSGPNATDDARRLLYFTYNRLSAGDHLLQYYADKRASYPPDIERDPGKEYQYRV